MSRWFRHYAGMMRDEKLVRVSIKSGQPIERVVWIYGAILESAAEIDDNGRYDLDPAEVAYFLRASEDDVGAVFAGLENAGRIASGAVVKWGNRQFSSDRSAARVAAHRERKRAENRGRNSEEITGNGDVTLQEPPRNAPETELETETEKEVVPIGTTKRASARVVLVERPGDVEEQVWIDFNKLRKRKGEPLSLTALRAIKIEADKAGWTLNEALTEAVARNWQGFKAEWVEGRQNGGTIRQGNGSGADKRSGLARAIDRELERVSALP